MEILFSWERVSSHSAEQGLDHGGLMACTQCTQQDAEELLACALKAHILQSAFLVYAHKCISGSCLRVMMQSGLAVHGYESRLDVSECRGTKEISTKEVQRHFKHQEAAIF